MLRLSLAALSNVHSANQSMDRRCEDVIGSKGKNKKKQKTDKKVVCANWRRQLLANCNTTNFQGMSHCKKKTVLDSQIDNKQETKSGCVFLSPVMIDAQASAK